MTPLERALRERIALEGPMSIEAFMEACNAYYYSTRDPLGARGDFTTAPEISQMFGELIGAAITDSWIRAGKPAEAVYAELGPGRGTLANDALRVLRSRGFAGEVHSVETSSVLREEQRRTIPAVQFHESIHELPERPLLLVANEFLDALPVRQFVSDVERHVILAPEGFAFDRSGEIIENSPARDEAVATLAMHLVRSGGVALVFDYGHMTSAAGDTLQAVRGHAFAPVLECAGEQDLTSHVDFEAVVLAAKDAGASVSPVVTQGEWLIRLGIEARALALSGANPRRSGEIEQALHRLCDPEQMGSLFKVVAIHSPAWPEPTGFQ